MYRPVSAKPLTLKARAIALLAQREHSVPELRRKLLRIARNRRLDETGASGPDPYVSNAGRIDESGEIGTVGHTSEATEPAAEIDALLVWLQAQGYLSEQRFIEGRIHVRAQRFGLQRIQQELAQHGLTLDAEQQQALKADELERARAIFQRKFGTEVANDPALRAKQMRFLAGRGFSADVIRRLLRSSD